jgi:succinoglycan biosynthesis protein ExoM
MSTTIDISICICTFRRPALLERLLMALTEQSCDGLRVEVVVVDNDPAGSAADVLRNWQSRMTMPLHVRHETTPNIAQARNTAVHTAQGEWVLFIDDDETPGTDWIHQLVSTQRRYDADAVFAPVLPRYHDGTPDWIRAGDFFNRQRFATGSLITAKDARTGNVLIRRSKLMTVPGPFDTAFGRTGAEDTMLFRDMLAHGANFVWCDEAAVSEEVPAQRANLNWLLRRSYRLGQTYILTEIARLDGRQRFLRVARLGARALLQLPVAAGAALLALPFSRIASIRWLRTMLAQCGKLSALMGHRYHEYGN